MVLNAATHVVVGAGKFDHLTPVLRDVLHWLLVLQRIQFKVALTAFDCVRGFGPTYFRDFCISVADISSRSNLRSVQRVDMVVLCTDQNSSRSSELSRCSTTAVVWNAIPVYRRSTSISRGLEDNSELELFNQAYDTL